MSVLAKFIGLTFVLADIESCLNGNLLQAKTIDIKHEKRAHPSPENAYRTTPEELSAGDRYLLSEEAGTVNGAKIPPFGPSGSVRLSTRV